MSGRRSRKMKKRDKILLTVGVVLGVFIIYTLAVYTIRGWQWDSLFPYVLGVGGIVDVMTAVIAITDKKEGKKHEAETDEP